MSDDDEVHAIEFHAEVRQIKTMVDHSFNVTLNLPEYCRRQAAWFLGKHGKNLKLVAIDEDESVLSGLANGTNETQQRTARNPLGVDSG